MCTLGRFRSAWKAATTLPSQCSSPCSIESRIAKESNSPRRRAIWRRSDFDTGATRYPRRSSETTNPSDARCIKASRNGDMPTSYVLRNSSKRNRSPGWRLTVSISVRRISSTSAVRVGPDTLFWAGCNIFSGFRILNKSLEWLSRLLCQREGLQARIITKKSVFSKIID